MFYENEPSDRLHSTDAHSVDVIHTYSGNLYEGYSILEPLGHKDIYVNGGREQPGCTDPPFGSVGGEPYDESISFEIIKY